MAVIEKWEGPCWSQCVQNKTKGVPCEPSCDTASYQLATIRAIKAINPRVSTVFYLNTLYDFETYHLYGELEAAGGNMRDVHGRQVGLEQDGGMPACPVYDFANSSVVDRFLSYHKALVATGLVDGTFPDKSNAFAMRNASLWQICESPHGATPGGSHAWADMCAVISPEQANDYNVGRERVLDGLFDIYGADGTVWSNQTDHISIKGRTSPADFIALVNERFAAGPHGGYRYVYVMVGDDGTRSPLVSTCTDTILAMFMLALRPGMILGCNGWEERFDLPLGDPLSPALSSSNGIWRRSFARGASVRFNESSQEGVLSWPDAMGR